MHILTEFVIGLWYTLMVIIITTIVILVKNNKIIMLDRDTAKSLKRHSDKWETNSNVIERVLAFNDFYHATRMVVPEIDFKMYDPLIKVLNKIEKKRKVRKDDKSKSI